jgi:hypothetical protein
MLAARLHLLSYYGPWPWEQIDAGFDLSRSCSTTRFRRAAQAAIEADGQVVPRLGAHSFRRVQAADPSRGGMSQKDLDRVPRHHSPTSALT